MLGLKMVNVIVDVMDDKSELIYYPDADMMRRLMLESDIVVSGGGQTLYELARIGTPVVAVGLALNQLHNLDYWQTTGFIEYAGFWDDNKLISNVKDKIELLMDKDVRLFKSGKGKNFVDGRGAVRIVSYCLNKFYQ